MKKKLFLKMINFRVVGLLILIALLSSPRSAVSDTVTVDINLAQGYNLFSVPILPTNNSTETVLSGLSGDVWAYYYDASIPDELNRWKIYDSTAIYSVDNTLTNIEPNKGYWLHVSSEQTLSVEGDEPADNSMTLYTGWNMVSFQDLDDTVENVLATMSLSSGAKYIYYWDAFEENILERWEVWDSNASPSDNTLINIEPTKGYLLFWDTTGNEPFTSPPVPSAVPIPPTILLFSSGLIGIVGIRKKLKK